jgi:quercetin dioxygenase-like cupin family protein
MRAVVPPIADSALAVAAITVGRGEETALHDAERDMLLYILSGDGSVTIGGTRTPLAARSAVLVLAGEQALLSGAIDGICATAADVEHRHASLGPREHIVRVDPCRAEHAVEARAYQVLFGPHNGSLRATLFVGYVPPGQAPWHYHLYDEIVFLPDQSARVHREGAAEHEEIEAGSAFRIRPREVHIVENPSADTELTLVGVFTPAGSPAAAYLADHDGVTP